MKKRMTTDPWFIRRITLDRLVSTLQASARLAPTLEEEQTYLEAAEAVRLRMSLPKEAIDPDVRASFDAAKAGGG